MRNACFAALLAGAVAGSAQSAEPRPAPPAQGVPGKMEPVDVELLEFLGSLDTEEEEWREYLEERPVKAAAGKPVEQKAPPRQPDPKQVKQVKKP
jgi:hypothetical protein